MRQWEIINLGCNRPSYFILLRTLSWTVFPRIYTNLQSKVCFQFSLRSTARNFNNSRPIYLIFWEVRNHYRKFDSWKIQNVSIFSFRENSTKNGQIFQLFTLYSKGHHFSIANLDILIFCNTLHLEMDFWNLSWKRIVSSYTFWQKTREKHYKWDIEKNGIAYSAPRNTRNSKIAYLWNFHLH